MLDNTLSKVVYVADGIQKQWDIPFEFYKIEDVHIYITSDGENIEEIDQNYYYDEEGKFFIYPTEESELDPIPAGTQVLILRETENTQLEDSSEIYFKSKDIERGLDNLTMQVQDLKRDSLRAVKLSHFATQTPEDFTKGIFEAEKRAKEAAANASLSEQNAASSESSAIQASASATASAELAQSAANNGLQYAERAENAAAGSAASAASAAESANLAQDLLNQFDGNVYSKPEIDAKVSGLQAEIDLVESYIPSGTNDVNTLVNKQQLLDEEMDIREDLNEGLSEIQTQITAQAAAIASKQEKLVAGNNITIDGNVISATGGGGGGSAGSADIAKAIENQNTAIDTINPIYNWVGTKQEYEEQNIAEEHPDWICFITDDIGEDDEEVYPATEEQAGIVVLASQNEALEGFDDSKAMTPLKTAQKVYESVGRVIQLGFDGTLSGNILTFEPDTDTPYEIKNGFSYEIDLLFPAVVADGVLDENIEMVINNNGESIKIINALNDNTSTNITVGNMKQIMKYTTDIGFRWIFNARFTTTQDGTKVFVMPSTVINFTGTIPSKTSELTNDSGFITADDLPESGGASKAIGEVFYSQSSLVTDNPGALPLWTGESVATASTIYPDFYTWVKDKHPELCKTKEQYDATLTQFGECPFYVVDEEEGSLRLPKLSLLNRQLVERKEATETDPTWYNLYSDGYLEQGGKIGRTSAGQTTTIKLVKPFANTNYTVLASTKPDDSDSISGRIYTVSKNLTTTSFNVTNNGWTSEYNGITGFWEAKGYVGTNSLENNFPWVFAYNATVPASTAQAAEFQQGLSGKADADLNNTIPSKTFRENVFNWGLPDLTSGVTKSWNTDITAETNGWVRFTARVEDDAASLDMTINGTNVFHWWYTYDAQGDVSQTIPVAKGDVYKVSGASSTQSITFYPCKGEAL